MKNKETNASSKDKVTIILRDKKMRLDSPSWEAHYLIYIPKDLREFFLPYKIEFNLQTDIGRFPTWMVGESSKIGDPLGGRYMTRNMRYWFRAHPELEVGSVVEFTKLEDLLYKLNICTQ